MKQMQVPASMLVTVDFEDKAIPEAIREFRPAVYRDGESFCVLLGEDPKQEFLVVAKQGTGFI